MGSQHAARRFICSLTPSLTLPRSWAIRDRQAGDSPQPNEKPVKAREVQRPRSPTIRANEQIPVANGLLLIVQILTQRWTTLQTCWKAMARMKSKRTRMKSKMKMVCPLLQKNQHCSPVCNFTEDQRDEHESFDIKYEVPYSNGVRTLTLSSTAPFAEFLEALTKKMMGSAASIGYIPSFLPKSPKPLPRLLEDEESYGMMIEDINDFIAASRAKNRGKGVVKPFHIQIIKTSSDGDSKKAKTVKTNDPQPALPAEIDEDQEHKLLQQIEKHHACSEHKGKACYVRNDGSHYQYTFSDLSVWAMMLVCPSLPTNNLLLNFRCSGSITPPSHILQTN